MMNILLSRLVIYQTYDSLSERELTNTQRLSAHNPISIPYERCYMSVLSVYVHKHTHTCASECAYTTEIRLKANMYVD